jgi:osmotically-inducible protein OsmY
MKYKFIRHAVLVAAGAALVISGAQARPPEQREFFFADKQLSDDSIHDQVIRKLANDPDVKGGALQIDVQQGVVTIRGKVETDKQRQKAEKLARKISGVKKVINEITLSRK